MQYIDLDKLKIRKVYNFKTTELWIDLNDIETIIEMKEAARQAFKAYITESGVENYYSIQIDKEVCEDPESYFITAVNVFSAVFFDSICTTKGRPRERRLDVPEQLKVAKTNMSMLKRAVNAQTIVNTFNFTINWSISGEDFGFNLLQEDEADDC